MLRGWCLAGWWPGPPRTSDVAVGGHKVAAKTAAQAASATAIFQVVGLSVGRHSNIAIGNARVGVQGESVTIHGGIQLGGPDSGGGTADFAARTDEPEVRRGKLKQALNWARGVLRGIAGLAAGVTAIMTAVRSVT